MVKHIDNLIRKAVFFVNSYQKKLRRFVQNSIRRSKLHYVTIRAKRGGIMNTVKDIVTASEWFLHKEPMTHKKIQKLCYYYKAWGLALCDADFLPGDEFEAWVHGPVNPSLYAKYKDYRWNDIPSVQKDNSSLYSEKELDILESVWLTYGNMSANALEAQTHVEEPWREARTGYDESQNCTNIISHETMKRYYRNLYYQNQGE